MPRRRWAPARAAAATIAAVALALFTATLSPLAIAQPGGRADDTGDDSDVPRLGPPRASVAPPGASRRVTRVDVESTDAEWPVAAVDLPLRPGQAFSASGVRQAARALLAGGGVAEVFIDVDERPDGVRVRLRAVPQRHVVELIVQTEIDVQGALREAGIERGGAVTPATLRRGEAALVALARRRGYGGARATIGHRLTDDPLAVVLDVDLTLGPRTRIAEVRLEVAATSMHPRVRELVRGYGASRGDALDEDELAAMDRRLVERLRAAGWHHAVVTHRVVASPGGPGPTLVVESRPGPLVRLRFEGNQVLDDDQLEEVVDLEREADRSPGHAAQRVREEYQRLGFLDVEVSAEVRGGEADAVHDLVVTVREHERVRVVARSYPCLTGSRTGRDIGSEIDSFLEEELPGSTLLGAVDPRVVDLALGPLGVQGARPAPLDLTPQAVFMPETYDRALKHVQDLYRSEGYLSALVGPLQVVRRRCDPRSPPGQCRPVALPTYEPRCLVDPADVPLEEPPLPAEAQCKPNAAKGVVCEPTLSLRIPVKPGPRAALYDVAFDGAASFSGVSLLQISQLDLGSPASSVRIEEARRRVLEHYRDEGFAFAQVGVQLDLSPDKQRARVRFQVLERQRVLVDDIVVRGNSRTSRGVILDRVRLTKGGVYRQRDVRRTEELVATLGVFSSVRVELEDAAIAASRKVVIVTVAERDTQYLEVRPGLSTGEGLRGVLEYGHRNLGGRAIQLTLRVQLSYLPDSLIPDDQVRENFGKLPLGQRLERRNSAGVQFPNVFDPSLRGGFELIDVRSNSRDFGLTKDAFLPSLTWAPRRRVTATFGSSVERNDVGIFSGQTIERYLQQPGVSNDLSRLLRVPDGETTAIGQRLTASWDRRDTPLGATQGTLLAGSVEHVHAFPAEDNPNTITSDFLRFTGRIAAYTRLSKRGAALAIALAGGVNRQLADGSKTYPDRLFFLGGVDSMRGFLRDSLVPQDIADRIEADADRPADEASRLTIDKVAIRGGDVFVNPRAELRLPLSGIIETALFVDAGNLWVDPQRIEPLRLRYAGGSGLRVATPIGPVAFDYGINLSRRAWEDFGAFHFSIGLF